MLADIFVFDSDKTVVDIGVPRLPWMLAGLCGDMQDKGKDRGGDVSQRGWRCIRSGSVKVFWGL
jgi:hypothetical protein